jgi:hypothetical protein
MILSNKVTKKHAFLLAFLMLPAMCFAEETTPPPETEPTPDPYSHNLDQYSWTVLNPPVIHGDECDSVPYEWGAVMGCF